MLYLYPMFFKKILKSKMCSFHVYYNVAILILIAFSYPLYKMKMLDNGRNV